MPTKINNVAEPWLLQKLAAYSFLGRETKCSDIRDTPRFCLSPTEAPDPCQSAPVPLVEQPFDLTETAVHHLHEGEQQLSLRGTSLLCRCPECGAPLTIRDWLGLGDCWNCVASMGLDLEVLPANQPAPPAAPPATTFPDKRNPFPTAALNQLLKFDSTTESRPPLLSELAIQPMPTSDLREAELGWLTRQTPLVRWARQTFQLTPAWFISLILHLIVVLILALIILNDRGSEIPRITLSTFFSPQRELGGQIRLEPTELAIRDDLEIGPQLETGEAEQRKVRERAEQDASQLRFDPRPSAPLPDLSVVRQNITTRPDQLISFAARDPRVRAEIVTKEGGTSVTEAAVARGLRWLISVQNRDGSWSLAHYVKSSDPKNKGDAMATSLALLPLLGAGQTHEYGIYKNHVAAGLAWLIDHQLPDGDLRAGFKEEAGMYAHGQAAIVLCEAFAMTGDERLRQPAQRAIRFIEQAQHQGGGWRYRPGEPGDTSVFGWQMMALQSARAPQINLEWDDSTFKLADYYLDQVAAPANLTNQPRTRLPTGATYAYLPGRRATPAMTAEAILCRLYLGWDRQDPRLTAAVNWLISDHPPDASAKNVYYWYYATQVMHHYGGEPWQQWNSKMKELLVLSQQNSGRFVGSWSTDICPWGPRGGRIYTTSFACCILEVYYRHLPLFHDIELD